MARAPVRHGKAFSNVSSVSAGIRACRRMLRHVDTCCTDTRVCGYGAWRTVHGAWRRAHLDLEGRRHGHEVASLDDLEPASALPTDPPTGAFVVLRRARSAQRVPTVPGVPVAAERRAGRAEACRYSRRRLVERLAVDLLRVAANVGVPPRAIGIVPRRVGRVLSTHSALLERNHLSVRRVTFLPSSKVLG